MVAASSAGHSGAASATWEHVHRHFAVAALFVAQNAADPSGGPKIDSHVDFDATGAWRHHVSMRPSSRSQSAATTALTAGIGAWGVDGPPGATGVLSGRGGRKRGPLLRSINEVIHLIQGCHCALLQKLCKMPKSQTLNP